MREKFPKILFCEARAARFCFAKRERLDLLGGRNQRVWSYSGFNKQGGLECILLLKLEQVLVQTGIWLASDLLEGSRFSQRGCLYGGEKAV